MKSKTSLSPLLFFFQLLHIEKFPRGSGCWEVSQLSVTSSCQAYVGGLAFHAIMSLWPGLPSFLK